jgi:phospholipid/cholesterol/gamma-HCH transport system substrate-binding protein
MEDRAIQFRVGILVLATIIIAAILVERFGGLPGLKRQQYTIYVRFPQAPGVSIDTPVLKSGILIGRVSRVTLLDDGGVVVTARIDANRQLKNNEICRISTGSILGDATLEFVPSNVSPTSLETYRDGEYLDGFVAQDPLRVMESATTVLDMLATLDEDVRRSLNSVGSAGDRVGDVAESVTSIIDNNQDQLRRVLTKAELALDRFGSAVATIDQLANNFDEIIGSEDFKIAIEQTVNDFPGLMQDARGVLATMQSASVRADQNLKNIEALTEPLARRGEYYAQTIDKTLKDLQTVLAQVGQFSAALNNSNGTLGQLIHDRQLYDQITSTVSNIEHLSRRMRPIVEDARVFADKIARDPGRLGVRGALDRSRTGIKR